MTKTMMVAGAGGFIGGWLARRLADEGHQVVMVDCKRFDDWWERPRGPNMFGFMRDLSDPVDANEIVRRYPLDEVYMLAADMGGMGFIANHKIECMRSVLTSTNMIEAAQRHHPAARYFYSSSACVYPGFRQEGTDNVFLIESDAYPADPEDGYGWEKLFSERMCRHYREETGFATRVARYHNVYGPQGTWKGGREKAPAAMCRKVARAVIAGDKSIEVWGDGEQTRTFMFIDDCVEGTLRIARGDNVDPVNLGSDELVSINELAELVMAIAEVHLDIVHVDGPQGVRGRASDNRMMRECYGWEPDISLLSVLAVTYRWVYDQVKKEAR